MTAADPRSGSCLGLSKGGFHRLAYTEWGRPQAGHAALCVHGLTRNGRDFDVLAGALAEQGLKVACPDVVGRGRSDRLSDPAGYGYPQYLADMNALIARLDVPWLDWIGTSMGGLIGMMMAAQPNTPLRRLVVNDVGPFIPVAALRRIGDYVGRDPRFAGLDAAEAYFREVHAPFGALTDPQWRRLTEHSVVPDGAGYRLAYDPAIAAPFQDEELKDVDLWPVWEAIEIPVLVLRGADSDLLLSETAAEMAARAPRAEVVEIPGCGHAPALMDERQIALVRDWLLAEAP
ncbi:MAG: alpha/beta hydrolase [Rhodospirillales bacterium]|nr:alpha/beta hydrolase [Rhodospirillales bacterium]MDH3791813.1 alpha/beta hydrolase [Rhodospirillales bacterium]MDH3910421.1 alpha/beta hydrolase [Rhodospirillales bacterium]MDH3917578.1 alpha/beta hydrolase [Rhodospirillales bacterium]MDH3966963.1 alpha/beta hydrolase [Rhodospirillales bacterium]